MGSGAHHQRNGKVLHNIIRSSAQTTDYLVSAGVQFVYAFAGTTEEDVMRAHSLLPMTAALSSEARVREQGFEHSSAHMRYRHITPSGTSSSLLRFAREPVTFGFSQAPDPTKGSGLSKRTGDIHQTTRSAKTPP